MTTARDIIKGGLRKISVLGTGSNLSNEDAQDALDLLNGILSSWSVEGNLVYSETAETFSLVSGQASYTIGTGGDFNTVRPHVINTATVTIGDTDYPLHVFDQSQYARITQKTVAGTPDIFYYDAGYPLGTIKIYPVPTGETITLYSMKPLTQFTTLDTDLTFPDEYRLALEYNLAEAIAPEYEREPPMTVRRMAVRTKKIIESQNNRNDKHLSTIDVPAGTQGGFNIYSGDY